MISESMVTLTFYGNLIDLLKKVYRQGIVQYALTRRASIKDIIESLNIPHTEVGKLIVQGQEADFDYIPSKEVEIHVYPMTDRVLASLPSSLWREHWDFDRFMVDINALKLARNLRIAGINTTIVPEYDLIDIGMLATEQARVLLTRNRQLLKCSTVIYGQLLCSEDHIEQFNEVVSRFRLKSHFQPFSRCLNCNGLLKSVAKEDIEHLLEPLTKKYYTIFKRCEHCQTIYWHGSHMHHMQAILDQIDL